MITGTVRIMALLALMSSLVSVSGCGFRLAGSDSNERFSEGTTIYVDGRDVFRRRESLRDSLRYAGAEITDEAAAAIVLTTDTYLRNRALQVDSNADATEIEHARTTVVSYYVKATKATGQRRFETTRQRLIENNDTTAGARLVERLNSDMAMEQNREIAVWLSREMSRRGTSRTGQ